MKIFIAVAVLVLAGCGTIKSESRVSTPLQARQYNSVAASFMNGATSVSVAEMSDERVLQIRMDRYGGRESVFRFPAMTSAAAVANIDKYFEWEQLASARGDALTKEIGRSRSWSSMGAGSGAQIKMSMHSGNERNHYLALVFCAAGTCVEDAPMFLDRAGAVELRNLLVQMDAGTLKSADSQVYK